MARSTRSVPRAARWLAAMMPPAEREELAADLAAEHAERRATVGRVRAAAWLWWQVVASVPVLLRRSWWRGWTGFEAESNEFRSGGPMLESWIMDARYAVRRLRKRPLYASLAILTLALGVGGTAAIFGIARELLLSRLPIAAEEDVAVWWMTRSWSEAEHVHLRGEGVPGFEAVAAFGEEDVRLTSDDATRVIPVVRTSWELFDVLGVRPLLGPGLTEGDDIPGGDPKVVLSHRLWRELGGRPDLIGTTLQLEGVNRTVAGVMPAGFWFPSPDTRAWYTRPLNAESRTGWYTVVGRLSAGQTPAQIDGALSAISASLADRFTYSPDWDNSRDPVLTPVREHILGSVRPTLVATLAAMAVILLIACANVAALMLGQLESRASELSLRTALGAGRSRIMRQLLLEGVAVGVAAGVAGAAFAAATFRLLLAALPLGALAERATLDWPVFWFALAVAVAAALLVVLIPVFAVVRADLRGALTASRTGGIAGRGGRLESGLVVAEVALAVVIAAGAAVLIRSVANLRAVETGMEVAGVAVMDVVVPAEIGNAERVRVIGELVDALAAVPGVESAGAAQTLPLRGGGNNWGLNLQDQPEVTGVTTSFRIVSRDVLPMLRARLVSGRLFESADRADTERVVIINESLARRFFPGTDPIGRYTMEFGEPARIVGVIRDIQERGLTDEPEPARYILYEQSPYAQTTATLLLRAGPGVDPLSLIAAARSTVNSTAPAVGVQEATTMERVFERALGPARQLMALLTMLSALALLLGGIGVYGVVSHFVNRRRRDWGVRMALGLRPNQVLGHVIGRGSVLVTTGIVIGVAGAVVLTRVLAAFVHDVGTADPAALLLAAVTLFTVGVLGALVPARRASRIDPARILREQ